MVQIQSETHHNQQHLWRKRDNFGMHGFQWLYVMSISETEAVQFVSSLK